MPKIHRLKPMPQKAMAGLDALRIEPGHAVGLSIQD
jgi:hypothetical protein